MGSVEQPPIPSQCLSLAVVAHWTERASQSGRAGARSDQHYRHHQFTTGLISTQSRRARHSAQRTDLRLALYPGSIAPQGGAMKKSGIIMREIRAC